MSAETEMEKDEVKVVQERKSLKQILKEQWPIGIKILELVSVFLIFHLIYLIAWNL